MALLTVKQPREYEQAQGVFIQVTPSGSPDTQVTQPMPRLTQSNNAQVTGYPSLEVRHNYFGISPSRAGAGYRQYIIDDSAFDRLRLQLRRANWRNRRFKTQFQQLAQTLFDIVNQLNRQFSAEVEQVWLISDDLLKGVDLRELPYDAVVLTIVLSNNNPPYRLYRDISRHVFAHVDRQWFLPQFHLVSKDEWLRLRIPMDRMNNNEPLGLRLSFRA